MNRRPADSFLAKALTPLDAVRAAVRAGMIPQGKIMRWARVVIESEAGKPAKALRFNIYPEHLVPLEWTPSEEW